MILCNLSNRIWCCSDYGYFLFCLWVMIHQTCDYQKKIQHFIFIYYIGKMLSWILLMYLGIALGMYCTQQVQLLALFFNKRGGLAMGLLFAAMAVGGTSWPILMQYLFLQYSWQGTLLIIVGVHIHILIAVCLIPPSCGKVPGKSR